MFGSCDDHLHLDYLLVTYSYVRVGNQASCHEGFQYDFRNCTPQLSKQKKLFIGYSVLIGCVFRV